MPLTVAKVVAKWPHLEAISKAAGWVNRDMVSQHAPRGLAQTDGLRCSAGHPPDTEVPTNFRDRCFDLEQSFGEGLPLAPLFASSRAERATVRDRIAIGATICHLAFLAVGCARLPEPSFTISSQTQKLKPEFQKQIAKILGEQCGRPLCSQASGQHRPECVALASEAWRFKSTRVIAFNATG